MILVLGQLEAQSVVQPHPPVVFFRQFRPTSLHLVLVVHVLLAMRLVC